jgi:hypothetical protein
MVFFHIARWTSSYPIFCWKRVADLPETTFWISIILHLESASTKDEDSLLMIFNSQISLLFLLLHVVGNMYKRYITLYMYMRTGTSHSRNSCTTFFTHDVASVVRIRFPWMRYHCRVRETVQIFRDTVLPSNMEEGTQLKGTCHFIF